LTAIVDADGGRRWIAVENDREAPHMEYARAGKCYRCKGSGRSGTLSVLEPPSGRTLGVVRNARERRVVILAMFRYAVAAVLTVLCAVTALGLSPALASGHHPKPAVAADKDSFSFNGTVAKVDYAANTVELSANGRDVTIVVEPTTAIDVAGEPGSVSDIRPGVRIHAEGTVRDGTFVAETISIRGGNKPKHSNP